MNKKAIIYATGDRGVYVGRLERQFRRASVPSSLLVSLEDDLELVDPIRRDRVKGKSFLNLFMTHPPIEERIKALRGMTI